MIPVVGTGKQSPGRPGDYAQSRTSTQGESMGEPSTLMPHCRWLRLPFPPPPHHPAACCLEQRRAQRTAQDTGGPSAPAMLHRPFRGHIPKLTSGRAVCVCTCVHAHEPVHLRVTDMCWWGPMSPMGRGQDGSVDVPRTVARTGTLHHAAGNTLWVWAVGATICAAGWKLN